MDRNRGRRFDERRGGESYRPSERLTRSRSRARHIRSPPRNRSPRQGADTWVPYHNRSFNRPRSRSPISSRRSSRSPSYRQYRRPRSPLGQGSPRWERPKSPPRSSWRSKSPYRHRSPGEPNSRASRFFREPQRTGYLSLSPNRDQQLPPLDKHQRSSPPLRQPKGGHRTSFLTRSRSLIRCDGHSRKYSNNTNRRRTPSTSKGASSGHASIQESASTSQRSSPPSQADLLNMTPRESRNRLPTNDHPFSRIDNRSSVQAQAVHRTLYSPNQDRTRTLPFGPKEQADEGSLDRARHSDFNGIRSPHSSITSLPSHEQQQATSSPSITSHNYATSDTLPSAPSNRFASTSMQSRSTNISLLSAPTRPRGGPSFGYRDSTRAGNSTPRRGPGLPGAHQIPPTGPRSGFSQPSLIHEPHRPSLYRNSINTPSTLMWSHRAVNHLSGLPVLTPGGKNLPPVLDAITEKRLAQLEADREKLIVQVAEKQQLKRVGMKDWDRVVRESATNALKSELAGNHLQKMAEGDNLSNTTF